MGVVVIAGHPEVTCSLQFDDYLWISVVASLSVTILYFKKLLTNVAGEVILCLSAFDALIEDPSSILNIHLEAHNCL